MVANATEISSVWDDTTKKWVKPGEQSDPVPAKSNWRFYPKIDPITDQDTSAVMLSASSYSAAISDDPETLIVRCSKDAPGGYEIYITSKGYIGTHDRIAVEYRFDDNAPVSEYWGSSTDGTAAFLPSSYRDFGLSSSRPTTSRSVGRTIRGPHRPPNSATSKTVTATSPTSWAAAKENRMTNPKKAADLPKESLTLKWGTIKGWGDLRLATFEILQ